MATTRPQGSVYTKVTNGVATIVFAHPRNNALGSELVERLTKEFQKLSGDENVRVILLSSEDEEAFCTGASPKELASIETNEEAKLFFKGFVALYMAIQSCTKITVARVQGKAMGEGIGLIACCDYVYALDTTVLQLSELAVGLSPIIGTPLLIQKIGKVGLGELALNPTAWKNAYWGKEKGLFAKVVEHISDIDKELYFFTSKLATYDANALKEIKRTLSKETKNLHIALEEEAEISKKHLLFPATKAALLNI